MAPLLARRPACDRTFERLYRRHAGDVYRYALALLRDPTEAEDATQTAFMNAYRALVGGEEPRAPKAWLLAIVHNVCRMRRRSLARRPREVPLDDHPIAAVDDERPNLDVVLAALAELPLNQRAALVMREVEGRSYREISEVLGVSTSAVEALIFRARRQLRVRRDALGALAAAPLPASLGTLPGGAIATAVGTDVLLKAAAGVVAALVAGGAAYEAGTVAKGATTAPARKHAPAIRRVLVATPERPRPARAERHARSVKVPDAAARKHKDRRHRRRAQASRGAPAPGRALERHREAARRRPGVDPAGHAPGADASLVVAPDVAHAHTAPAGRLAGRPAAGAGADGLDAAASPVPTVTVPTPPPVPPLPEPPPPPKIP